MREIRYHIGNSARAVGCEVWQNGTTTEATRQALGTYRVNDHIRLRSCDRMSIVAPPLHPARGPLPVWADRFWAKATPTEGGCWSWTAGKSQGYGQFNKSGWGTLRAHRIAYFWVHGSIPEGLSLDHLCRNRACINPEHLEPVTCRENLLRGETLQAANAAKTHCISGHAFTPDNLLSAALRRGERQCRECHNRRARESYARKRAQKAGAA